MLFLLKPLQNHAIMTSICMHYHFPFPFTSFLSQVGHSRRSVLPFPLEKSAYIVMSQ